MSLHRDRGIYWRPYTLDGRGVVYPVDSFGRELPDMAMEPGESAIDTLDRAWNLLDLTDPVDYLKLAH